MEIQIAKGKFIKLEPVENFTCSPVFCKGCGKEIFYGKTKNGKLMPVSELADGTLVSHFFDCPKAKNFRK